MTNARAITGAPIFASKLARASIADIYALLALATGLFFLIVTPPFGSADETAHFERAYEVSQGAFTGADGVTAGMQTLMDDAFGMVVAGEAMTRADFARWSAIDLEADQITPWPEPLRRVMRLHSPLCYAHLAPVMGAGVALGLKPLTLFYLGRLIALIAGVILVRAAIATAPASFRPPLAFIALLPTTMVFFAAFNIESLLVGLGFYFFALVARAAADPQKLLTRGDIVRLVAIAFMLGQFKSGYLFLPAAALLLPAGKFPSPAARLGVLALIILPGALASLGWAMIVKTSMLGDVVYSTMNGNHVEPAAQLKLILADPIAYLQTVIRTLTGSDAPFLAWLSFLALGGWTNIQPPFFIYAVLSLAFMLVWLGGEPAPPALRTPFALLAQLGAVGATVLAILTLVYLQWNGVGAREIDGFQGRYFLACAPFILAAAPVRLSLVSAGRRREILAFGAPLVGLASMAGAIIERYY